MPSKRPGVWIDGKFYDWAHLPPWFDNVLPELGTYDRDGNLVLNPDTVREAEENAVRNLRGSEFVGAMIWVTLGLIVITLISVAIIFG